MDKEYIINELVRRINNVVRVGIIDAIDYEKKMCRLRYSNSETSPYCYWVVLQAGENMRYYAPSIGEQALFLGIGGNPDIGVILPGVQYSKYMMPDVKEAEGYISRDNVHIKHKYGEELKIESDKTTITIDLKNGDVQIQSEGKTTIKGDSIELDTGGLKSGVVTQYCKCAFTGAMHIEGSKGVKASG